MKKLLCIVLSLFILMSVSLSSYSFCAAEIEGEYTIDMSFADNAILFVLTKEASQSNPMYTVDDFPGLGVVLVRRITSDIQPGKSKQHIFYLELDKHDKQNVLDVIKVISKMDGMYAVEPDYYISPPDDMHRTRMYLNAFEEQYNVNVNENENAGFTEHYRYFSEDNDTKTPDWVFGYARRTMQPTKTITPLGDYYLLNLYTTEPFASGYFVYVPEDNKFYDIYDAQKAGIENLELAFKECMRYDCYKIGYIGDVDYDEKLSIIDAIFIQRALAGLCDFSVNDDVTQWTVSGDSISYISDYDRDGVRSIMDATAIQLKLANLI